jgi:hypothetical protein
MPRPRRALEIFLRVGATAGLLASAIRAPHAHAQQHHAIERSAEGGEGGEGGEAGPASAVQSDLDVLLVLAQMQGHLLVAQELLDQRQYNAAEPHVGHPVDELYGALQPALQNRGIPPFLPALEALRQQVRLNPGAPETAVSLAKAQQALAAVTQSVNGDTTTPDPMVLTVVRQLGETAAGEYDAALAGDQVVEVIEYQDARGFLLEAQRLLSGAIASQPADAAALKARQTTVAAMLKAFPTVMPPQKALMSVAQLQHLQQQL